jgi:plasmid stabilization system protein ParE
MEDIMAGTTVSFVADRGLVERVQEIAKADGVSQSQAAARASAFGALLPSASRILADAARMGRNHGGETEEDLAHMSVEAVRDTRRKRRDQPTANDDVIDPHSPGFGD